MLMDFLDKSNSDKYHTYIRASHQWLSTGFEVPIRDNFVSP
jgi:hypothetical protein